MLTLYPILCVDPLPDALCVDPLRVLTLYLTHVVTLYLTLLCAATLYHTISRDSLIDPIYSCNVGYFQEPEDLFETISQALLNAVDRDALSGWGAVVHIM